MSTTTDTRRTVKPAAPTVGSTPAVHVPTIADLRAALAVVDSGDARGKAGSTLKAVTLSRYVHHADTEARTLADGTRFIDSDAAKRVALAMWAEAGHGSAPKAEDRTPGAKSFAQYVSRFATVARTMESGYGVGALASIKNADAAYSRLSEAAGKVRAQNAANALTAWENARTEAEAEALAVVFKLLTTGSGIDVSATWLDTVRAKNAASRKASGKLIG